MVELASSSFFSKSVLSLKASHSHLQHISFLDRGFEKESWQHRVMDAFKSAETETPAEILAAHDEGLSTTPVDFSCCLGVGPIARSSAAQYQLAFFILTSLITQSKVMQVYDPVLTLHDRFVIARFGGVIPESNDEGSITGVENGLNLFYLPHCGAGLSSNVITANWSNISNTIIIGNSFQRTLDLLYFPQLSSEQVLQLPPLPHYTTPNNNAFSHSLLHTDATTEAAWVGIGRVSKWVHEIPLPSHHVVGGFNDTSIHSVAQCPADLHEFKPPVYIVRTVINESGVMTTNPEIIPQSLCKN